MCRSAPAITSAHNAAARRESASTLPPSPMDETGGGGNISHGVVSQPNERERPPNFAGPNPQLFRSIAKLTQRQTPRLG